MHAVLLVGMHFWASDAFQLYFACDLLPSQGILCSFLGFLHKIRNLGVRSFWCLGLIYCFSLFESSFVEPGRLFPCY